jgi:hypothetical protein
VISLLGAVAGTLLAWWVTTMAASVQLPIAIPLAFDLRIDARVLLFTLAATVSRACWPGSRPRCKRSRPNLVAIFEGADACPRRRPNWTLRDGLVVCQMAITAMLLVTAALLTRSLLAAQRTNVGLPVDKLAVVSTDTSMLRYPKAAAARSTTRRSSVSRPFPASNRWRSRPASLFGELQPLGSLGARPPSAGRARRRRRDDDGVARVFRDHRCSDRRRTRILERRQTGHHARRDRQRDVCRRYWPGQSAVGKTFRSRVSDGVEFQIVGVSADHKVMTVGEPPTPFLQVARTQRPSSYSAIIARTRGDASALLRDMRRELLALEPNLVSSKTRRWKRRWAPRCSRFARAPCS